MKEAFTYMFKDPRYNEKASVYFIICFIVLALMASPEISNINSIALSQGPKYTPVTNPIFALLPFVGSLVNIILLGYYYTCIQAITKQEQNYVLPFMKFGSSFIRGFKLILATILITIVLCLMCFILGLAGHVGVIIFCVFITLLFFILGNAFMWLFANEGKISTFFAWKKATKLVLANGNTYFKNLLVLFLLTLLGAFVSTLFMFLFNFLVNNVYIAWILTSIEGAIIASYLAFVGMYLIAKSIKRETVV